jgi:enoyl-CoA hydratase
LAETSLEKNPDVIVTETINAFSVPAEKSALMDRQVEIETCFSKNTVEEIMQALEHYPSAWCEQTATILSTKSPTSLKVTLRQLQTGTKLNFDECMALEYQSPVKRQLSLPVSDNYDCRF